MSVSDLGQKHKCSGCGIKFYDFDKKPIICPACQVEFDPDALLKSRRGRTSTRLPEAEAKKAKSESLEAEVLQDEEQDYDEDILATEDEPLKVHKTDEDEEESATSSEPLIDVLDDGLKDEDDVEEEEA